MHLSNIPISAIACLSEPESNQRNPTKKKGN